jgi:hypothetical protein
MYYVCLGEFVLLPIFGQLEIQNKIYQYLKIQLNKLFENHFTKISISMIINIKWYIKKFFFEVALIYRQWRRRG